MRGWLTIRGSHYFLCPFLIPYPASPRDPASIYSGNMGFSLICPPPGTDIILKSSDDVLFDAYRRILIESSPFFSDMFTLPQEDDTSIPTIQFSEPGSVLSDLLMLTYPGEDPVIDTLDKVSVILAAALKYEMVRATQTLRRLLVSPVFLEKEPTRVYAIASRYDLEEEARIASSYTLRINILDCPLSDELKHITAWSYHRLLLLHRRRSEEALKVLESVQVGEVKCTQCNGIHYGALSPPRWWTDFVRRASEELRIRPTSDVIFSMPFLAGSADTGCAKCALSILESHAFLERLKKRIDEIPSTI